MFRATIGVILLLMVGCSSSESCGDPTGCGSDGGDDTRTQPDDGDEADVSSDSNLPMCSIETCAGCCFEHRCYPGVTTASCGADGNACVDCGSERQCLDGACLTLGCGNGVVEEGESCDGAALPETACEKVGFGAGALSCNVACEYDVSACTGNPCAWDEANARRCRFCSGNINVQCGWCELSGGADSLMDCSATNGFCYDTEDGLDESTGSFCMPSAHEVPCEAATFVRHCSAANEAVSCIAGLTMSVDCDTYDMTCIVEDTAVAVCRDKRTSPCDSATFSLGCQGNDRVWCGNGYTEFGPCYADESCAAAATTLWCQSNVLGPCEPPNFICNANRAYQCVATDVWVQVDDCNDWESAYHCVATADYAGCSL